MAGTPLSGQADSSDVKVDVKKEAAPKKEAANEYKASACAPLCVALCPCAWLLWLLDFLVWFIYFLLIGWVFAIMRCCAPPAGQQMPDKSFRKNGFGGELKKSPRAGQNTAWDCFEFAFKNYAKNNCMGTRTYLGEWRAKAGDRTVKKVFGKTTWQTYEEVGNRARSFGKGLISLGMKPSPSKTKAEFEQSDNPDTLLLWENTCAEWMTSTAGAFSQSLVVATSYATLGIDGVMESINQCQCPVVICNRSEVQKLVDVRGNLQNPDCLKAIVYTNMHQGGGECFGFDGDLGSISKTGTPPELGPLDVQNVPEGLKIISFDEVVKEGEGMADKDYDNKPDKETMAVVMYTSGSTGKPKGVVIAHKNLCAAVAGLGDNFSSWGTEGEETYIAYLPAAHILELVAEMAMLAFGAELGYADPRTIASAGACRLKADGTLQFAPDLDNAPGAIQEFKPTCMAAVPKIWDILKKGIEDNIGGGSAVVRFLFDTCFAACANAIHWRYCPLLSMLFEKKVKGMVGGRLKIGISGGGPISAEVQSFCRTVFNGPLIQGYALTETTCVGCVQMKEDNRDGVVGAPLAAAEIRLNDCKEVEDRAGKPYLSTDTHHFDGTACVGRGEVWIRGPAVSLGYYATGDQAEALNKKTTDEFSDPAPNSGDHWGKDWFHTGDIGMFTPDGSLKLVDRLKNLVKLKGGEYIAVEQMETKFATSVYVDGKNGGVMVHGDGDMDKPVALVQMNMGKLRQFAESKGISGDDESICDNAEVTRMILDDLNRCGKEGGLARNEMLCAVGLIPGTGPMEFPGNNKSPWTPENGFLTASNKTDRNAIKNGKTKELTPGNPVTSPSFADILEPLRKTAGA